MTAIDILLLELQQRHGSLAVDLNGEPTDTGRCPRSIVIQVVGNAVRVSVTDHVEFADIVCRGQVLEADDITAEAAAAQLLSPSPFAAKE